MAQMGGHLLHRIEEVEMKAPRCQIGMAGIEIELQVGMLDLVHHLHHRLHQFHLDVLHRQGNPKTAGKIGRPAMGIEKLPLRLQVVGLDLIMQHQNIDMQGMAHLKGGMQHRGMQRMIVEIAQVQATPDVGGIQK
ncbi:hypothetical protein DSECCO2_402810 [anaerobic digester metagenome]